MTYQIYSLQKPPQLLRTITGGDFFSAADKDLDGRVEIWTHDAAAVDGFDNLVVSELDLPPTIVLRLAHGQLLDVSSEFRLYFDHQIAKVRAELDAQDLRDFKGSDGRLSPSASFSAERLHHLRGVKVKVFEIVWSYLYSGREQEAWHSLADMWPAADADRIRVAILDARARGIRAQVDGVSAGVPPGRKKHVGIFDAIGRSEPGRSDIIPPEPILLQRPPPLGVPEQGLPESELLLDLVIDSAGKVRSAAQVGNSNALRDLVGATAEWKFIPAFKAGRAVASRLRLAVSLKR
jgi:hypothetical protein